MLALAPALQRTPHRHIIDLLQTDTHYKNHQ